MPVQSVRLACGAHPSRPPPRHRLLHLCCAEDALLPVLNRRAYVILDSYNHKRGPVTAPLNVTAIMAGLPDAGASGAGCSWWGAGKVLGCRGGRGGMLATAQSLSAAVLLGLVAAALKAPSSACLAVPCCCCRSIG